MKLPPNKSLNLDNLLGKKIVDKITGFTGTATAYSVYLDSDPLVRVESLDSTNRPVSDWIETSRLEFASE